MSTDLDAWSAALSERLTTAIAADVRSLTEGLTAHDVLGVGVYTDADASNIVAAVQTREHYAALLERRPRYRDYFLWSIGEWDHLSFEAVDDQALQPINGELAARANGLSDSSSIESMRCAVWEAIVTAFARMVDDGLLNAFPHAVRVFEPVDANVDEATIRAWTARINDAGRMAEYDAWAANPLS